DITKIPHTRELVAGLAAALQDNDLNAREVAVGKLGWCSRDVPEAVDVLVAALKKHPAANVRMRAAEQFGNYKPPGDAVVPALVAALQDEHHGVRAAAASALGNLHRDANLVVPALVKLIGEGRMDEQEYVLVALAKYGPEAK